MNSILKCNNGSKCYSFIKWSSQNGKNFQDWTESSESLSLTLVWIPFTSKWYCVDCYKKYWKRFNVIKYVKALDPSMRAEACDDWKKIQKRIEKQVYF